MKSLVTSLRDRIAGVDKKKVEEYKKWSDNLKSTISGKFSPLMTKFRSTSKSSAIVEVVQEIYAVLKEMDDTSFLDCEYIDYVDNSYMIQTKRVLLDLWSDILEIISCAPLPNIGAGFYSFALWIMKRPEFDLSLVKIDQKKNKFSCSSECLSLYVEYKNLLDKTLLFVTENINSAINQSKVGPTAFVLDEDAPESDTSTDGKKRKKGKKPKGAKYIDDDDDNSNESDDSDDADPTIKPKKDDVDDEKERRKKLKKRKSSEAPDMERKKKSSKKPKRRDSCPEKQEVKEEDKEDEKVYDEIEEVGIESSPESTPITNVKTKDFMPERSPTSFMPSLFTTFAVKLLAFAYFRLPYLQNKIIENVLRGLEFNDNDFVCGPEENPIARKECVIMRRKCLASVDDYPGLLKWDTYLSLLGETQPAKSKKSSDEQWLEIFSGGMDFFFEFFSEWIIYVDRYIDDKIDWTGLPGFCEFSTFFFVVYELKDITQASITPFSQMPQSPIDEISGILKSPSIDGSQTQFIQEKKCRALQCVSRKALTACNCALLEVYEPYVLNGLMHVIFEKTRVFDINSLSGCLTELETWFACLDNASVKLDKGLDINLLCCAVDALLNTDHLLIITRFLMTLYDHSKIFSGHARLELFGKLLICKHFTHLFLFWENNVRTAYIQILLFKVLSRKRSSVISASKKKAEGQEPISSHDEINITLLEMMETRLKEVRKIESVLEHREKEKERNKKKDEAQLVKPRRSVSFDSQGTKDRKNKKVYMDEEEDKSALRKKSKSIPKALYIYVPRAMEDYRKKLSRYEAWEKAGGPQPKLILYKTVSGGKMQATPVRSQSAPLGKL